MLNLPIKVESYITADDNAYIYHLQDGKEIVVWNKSKQEYVYLPDGKLATPADTKRIVWKMFRDITEHKNYEIDLRIEQCN